MQMREFAFVKEREIIAQHPVECAEDLQEGFPFIKEMVRDVTFGDIVLPNDFFNLDGVSRVKKFIGSKYVLIIRKKDLMIRILGPQRITSLVEV